jgi:eukaryotic-like serine/threonine-protein kinase
MPLSAGDRLGPYEILTPIGKGGMGEVYRAYDSRLKRYIAIKVCAAQFSERFEREAQAVAALNHPNICQLYDVGPNYLVMEYIEGMPLKGPLPFDQAVKYAVQICDALDAAHRKGIVHRDLKPANILSTKSGIKLLDFGLAKLGSSGIGQASRAPDDATLTMALTGTNEIVGTLYYMSPEQLQAQPGGREIDARSDIFSFGVVLYEIVTGKRAFDGSSPASVIAAIMEHAAPSIADVAPAALDRVLKTCLAKDPDERWQTARDLKRELEWISSVPESGSAVPAKPTPQYRSWLPWCIAALFFSALLILYFRQRAPEAPRGTVFQIDAPERFRGIFQLSPDGRYLAIVAQRKLWIRPLNSLEAKVLDGVEDPTYPFWSPDSASVGFFSQGKLKKTTLNGGVVQTLCDAPDGRGAAWNREGTIVFASNGGDGGLQQVAAAGGAATSVTKLLPHSTGAGEEAHRYPVFLPDGRHFLFAYLASKPETAGIYAGSLDGGAPVRIVPDVSNPGYALGPAAKGTGYLLFIRERTLMAQPFDTRALRTTGEMAPVVQQLTSGGNTAYFAYSVSANAVMAYQVGQQGRSLELVWVDRTGKRLDSVSQALQFVAFALAPDETRLAVSIAAFEKSVSQADIWRLTSVRGAPSRFTYGPDRGWSFPVWSPDGAQLVYATYNVAGLSSYEIRRKPWNMTGKEELLLRSSGLAFPRDWSPDGKWLLYSTTGDLWLLPLEGDHKPIPFTQAPASNEDFGQFSPDGKWIAYASNESGQDQVYIQPIPATGAKSWRSRLHPMVCAIRPLPEALRLTRRRSCSISVMATLALPGPTNLLRVASIFSSPCRLAAKSHRPSLLC